MFIYYNILRITVVSLIAALTAVVSTGCGTDDAPLAPAGGDTGPATKAVTVTVGSVVVVANCEGSAANPGDFTWELVVRETGVDPADYRTFTGAFSGLSAEVVDIPDVTFTMTREPKQGDSFTLEFHVTEWDSGNSADSRMRDSIGDGYHSWKGGSDWNNGLHTVLVPGAPECRVNFVYTVDVN